MKSFLTSYCSNVYSTAHDMVKNREENEGVLSSGSQGQDCVGYGSISIWGQDGHLFTARLQNEAGVKFHSIPL